MDTLRRRRVWVPLLLFGLMMTAAAYLRLRGLTYTEMTGDQGILYTIAMTWVKGGPLPLTANKASAGIMNPPLVEYLIALPMMIRPTLLAAAQFQALLSLAALLLLYVYSAGLFNPLVALLATLLFALNPWAVYYSRFVWNPNPLPFFTTLLLGSWLFYLTRREAHPLHLSLAILALAAATQLHLSSLVLLGVLGVSGALFWRRLLRGSWWRTLWPLLAGLLLALLLYLPYFLFEAKVGWRDVSAIFGALAGNEATAGEGGAAALNLSSWLLVRELATGANLAERFPALEEAVPSLGWLVLVARVLLVAGLLYAPVRLVREWLAGRRHVSGRRAPGPSRDLRIPFSLGGKGEGAEMPAEETEQARFSRRTVAYVVLALWLLVPVVAYLRHTVYLQNYYFLYVWPAPFLLTALLLDDLLAWLRSWLAPATFAAAAVLLLAPVLLLGVRQFQISKVGLDLAESGETRPAVTLGEVQAVLDASQAQLAAYPECELIVVTETALFEKSTFGPIRPAVRPRPVRFLQAGRGYVIPEGCALYLLARPDPLVEAWVAGAGEQVGAVRSERGSRPFYYVPPAPAPSEAALARWENGLALLEVEAPDGVPAGSLPLTYRWQVTEDPPDLFYHFFNHVLNEQGELVAQLDAVAIDTRIWEEGDRLVAHFEVPLPELAPGTYTVQVGLYTWPDVVRVPLVGGGDTYQVLDFERR